MRINVSSGRGRTAVEQSGRQDEASGADDPAATARNRVLSYLATFDEEPDHLVRLAEALTARAAPRCRLHPERDLGEIAVEVTESDLAAWSFFVLGRERVDDHSAVLVARAAYRACGGGGCWPGVLLRYDLPAGFVDAMRAAAPPPTPPERPGRMVQQPLDTWSPAELALPGLWQRLISALAGTSRF